MSSYRIDKEKLQQKAKGFIAKRLEKLGSPEKTFTVNVNGFFGNIKMNVNVPKNINNQIKKTLKNVPIYVISAHGENIGNIHFSRDSFERGLPIIEEKRDGHMFEVAGPNQWVIHSAPIRTLVCPSKFDIPFMQHLTKYPTQVKRTLFSKNPGRLFKNISFEKKKTKFSTPNFSLPGLPYTRKRYWFYDDPEVEKSYDWFTGVYPIFTSHGCLSTLYDMGNVYRNKKPRDLEERIFNEDLYEKLNWTGRGSLKKKYEKLTNLIHSRLPKYDEKKNRWSGGKSVCHKEIMDIMGPGIYISLTCSPFINQNNTNVLIDKDILSVAGELLIEKVSKLNREIWENYYLYRRVSRRTSKTFKQEIYDDEEAVPFGGSDTGIKISKRGRMIYKNKTYVPGETLFQKKKKEKKKKSSSESDWSSSSDED